MYSASHLFVWKTRESSFPPFFPDFVTVSYEENFHDIELLIDIGEYQAGTKMFTASIDYMRNVLTLYPDIHPQCFDLETLEYIHYWDDRLILPLDMLLEYHSVDVTPNISIIIKKDGSEDFYIEEYKLKHQSNSTQ